MTTSDTVRVARFHGEADVRFENIPARALGVGEVRLRNAFNGICGTDLHLYYHPDTSVVPLTRDQDGNIIPIPIGHEYSGTVEETGPGVTRVKVGDRVAVFPVAYCGDCDACRSAAPAFTCTNQGAAPGGVGESDIRHERHLHLLPDTVSLRHGALVEPMAVSYHAVRIADPAPDSTVVIAGAGPIGVGVYLALRARGIENILVSEPSAQRRTDIEHLGATAIDPAGDALTTAVQDLSNGRGAAVFFDAAGAGPVVDQGMSVLGAYGQYIVVAVHPRPVPIDLWALQTLEKRIVGSIIYTPQDYDDVIDLMSHGAYPTEGWVTVRPATEIDEVMETLRNGSGTKILLNNQA